MPTKNLPRIRALDFLRGIAVILMFCTHTARLRDPAGRATSDWHWLDNGFRLLMQIEPFIFALFLFIAGFSTVLHVSKSAHLMNSTLRSYFFRFLVLALLSTFFFIAEKAPQWPAMFISSGPLLAIGFCTLVTGVALSSGKPWLAIGLTGIAAASVSLLLEINNVSVLGLSHGNGAVLNEMLFAVYGAILGKAYYQSERRGLIKASLVLAPLSAVGYLYSPEWVKIVEVQFFQYGKDPTLLGWFSHLLFPSDVTPYNFKFWNYTLAGALKMTGPLCLAAAVMLATPVSAFPGTRNLAILGAHALSVYVFHFILLGALVILGVPVPHSGAAMAVVFVLTALSIICANLIERKLIQKHSSEDFLDKNFINRNAA